MENERVGELYQERLMLRDKLLQKAILKARSSFYHYVQLMAAEVFPEGYKDGRHIWAICARLQAVADGKCKRLQIFQPPNSSKSSLSSILFPSWIFGKHPYWQFLEVSHSGTLAEGFGRRVRDLLSEPLYKRIFPGTQIREDVAAAGRWYTQSGGQYHAVGAGKNIAGMRGNIIVLDDVLSEQDALSPAARKKIREWYPQGLRSRLQPKSAIVVVNTRWSLDDLSGFLLDEAQKNKSADQWEVLSIPALLDEKSAHLLGYEKGTSFWPERWSTAELIQTRESMPEHQWAALYMQSPVIAGGNIVKRTDFRVWKDRLSPTFDFILQTIDSATSTKERSSYSVIHTWGIFHTHEPDAKGAERRISNMFLIHKWRDRVLYTDLRDKAQALYDKYQPDLIVIEKRSSGEALIPDLNQAGIPVFAFNPQNRDKMVHLQAAATYLRNGHVWIQDKEWAWETVDEICNYPSAPHDDEVTCFYIAALALRDNYLLEHRRNPIFHEEPPKPRQTYWS